MGKTLPATPGVVLLLFQFEACSAPGALIMSSRLGEILVKEHLITADQLKQAMAHQRQNGGRLGTALMQLGFISDDEITEVLSRQHGLPSFNLKYYEVDPAVIKLIPQDT